jgi:hypothetical protein
MPDFQLDPRLVRRRAERAAAGYSSRRHPGPGNLPAHGRAPRLHPHRAQAHPRPGLRPRRRPGHPRRTLSGRPPHRRRQRPGHARPGPRRKKPAQTPDALRQTRRSRISSVPTPAPCPWPAAVGVAGLVQPDAPVAARSAAGPQGDPSGPGSRRHAHVLHPRPGHPQGTPRRPARLAQNTCTASSTCTTWAMPWSAPASPIR